MKYQYRPRGTCSQEIDFELDGERIVSVEFFGGCPGNLTAIGKLVRGMTVDDVIARLKGIRCGGKPTSCPDQLALALLAVHRRDVK